MCLKKTPTKQKKRKGGNNDMYGKHCTIHLSICCNVNGSLISLAKRVFMKHFNFETLHKKISM